MVCLGTFLYCWSNAERRIGQRRFLHNPDPLSLMEKGEVVSTNGRPQQSGQKNTRVGHLRPKRPVAILSEQKFRARFHIMDTILIQLTDGEALFSANLPNYMMYFTKEWFANGLCLPIPSFFKQYLHFMQILLAFLHPNIVRLLIGCSVLDMLFQLDLSLLEVLFIYTLKMSQNERFSLSAHISSLQLVIGLPNSCKG